MKAQIARWSLLCLLGCAAWCQAHDMSLSLVADGTQLHGLVQYSDGNLAEGLFVEVRDNESPEMTPLMLLTDARGRFRLPVLSGHHYSVQVEGDEGHRLSELVHIAPWRPPLYLVLAVLLLVSLLPALALRRRGSGSAPGHDGEPAR